MKRRKRITAGELMDELSRDPEYQVRIAERDERYRKYHEEYAEEDAQLVREARKLGYRIKSVWDFVDSRPNPFEAPTFDEPYERAYPMLVRHLALPHHHVVREGIIRALTVKDGGPLVSQALYEQFMSEKDVNLRWLFANALKVAMPLNERKKYPEIAVVYRGKGAL